MLSKIIALADELSPHLIKIRRHLHTNPELSGEEYQTAAYIAEELSSHGIPVTEAVGKTGVVGNLITDVAAKTLAIRVDMDALPIQECNDLEFASVKPGVMHACGHDVHTTVGLGTAMILAQLSGAIADSLRGNIRFLFQPAEEITKGAQWMIDDGALEGAEAILGLHVFPTIPAKSVGIRYGALTAAADNLEIFIYGEAGHGARPHQAKDAIWVASQVITSLQQAISRTQNPLRPVVLTIGKIQGGRAPNIIADQVQMQGTVRSLHPETHKTLPDWIEQIVAGVCQTYGVKYKVNYQRGVPSVQNDLQLTQLLEQASREALGDQRIQILPDPSLGAEDFAVYLDHLPGAMFRLGVGHQNRLNYPLHHPLFDIDESAIRTGVITLAYTAYKYFQQFNEINES